MQDEQKVIDDLISQYRSVKYEISKGAKTFGFFNEPIEQAFKRIEEQLRDKGLDPHKMI